VSFQSKIVSKKLKIPIKTSQDNESKIFKLDDEKKNKKKDFQNDINEMSNNQNNVSITKKNECPNCDNLENAIFQPYYLDIIIKKNFGEIIDIIKNTIKQSEMRLIKMERREIIQNEWSDIAMILDRLLCFFFTVSTILTCLIIFLNSPYIHSKK
jgi:hypothetical protein